jgi:hypothetical protein
MNVLLDILHPVKVSTGGTGLRSAVNVSKCGHNVTGALSGCRFQDREVGG